MKKREREIKPSELKIKREKNHLYVFFDIFHEIYTHEFVEHKSLYYASSITLAKITPFTFFLLVFASKEFPLVVCI